jgi:hypothetical protein
MNEDAGFLVFAVATTFVNSWQGGVPFFFLFFFSANLPLKLGSHKFLIT